MYTLILVISLVMILSTLGIVILWNPKSTTYKYFNKISRLINKVSDSSEAEILHKLYRLINTTPASQYNKIEINKNLMALEIKDVTFNFPFTKSDCYYIIIKNGKGEFTLTSSGVIGQKVMNLLLKYALYKLEEYNKKVEESRLIQEDMEQVRLQKQVLKALGDY